MNVNFQEGVVCPNKQCYLLIITAVCILWSQSVHGSGQLEIKILNYTNPKGSDVRGFCCDSYSANCDPNLCDPVFHVCVTPLSHYGQPSMSCSILDVTSVVFYETNFIDFTQTATNLKFSLVNAFQSWDGGVNIAITVTDDDSQDDLVDDRIGVLSANVSVNFTNGPSYLLDKIENHGITMFLTLKATCDADYYGSGCDTKCVATNDGSGHYTCNKDGSRNCLPGWLGVTCDRRDLCLSRPCQHNGVCSNTHSGVTCDCTKDYTGEFCETLLAASTSASVTHIQTSSLTPRQSATASTYHPSTTSTPSADQSTLVTPKTIAALSSSTVERRSTTIAPTSTPSQQTTTTMQMKPQTPTPTASLSPQSTVNARVSTKTTKDAAEEKGDDTAGIVGGGVAAAVASIVGTVFGIFAFIRRRLKRKRNEVAPNEDVQDEESADKEKDDEGNAVHNSSSRLSESARPQKAWSEQQRALDF